MSELNAEMILSIWEAFVDYLPPKEKADLAERLLKIFEDNGLDMSTVEDIEGVDKHLDKAIAEYAEEDDWDDDYDEYED